jgi:hypothetical protein
LRSSDGGRGCDAGWWGEPAGPRKARLSGRGLGGLDEGAGRPGQGDRVQAAELAVDVAPGQAGAPFSDADEQQRESAEQDVGADAGPATRG